MSTWSSKLVVYLKNLCGAYLALLPIAAAVPDKYFQLLLPYTSKSRPTNTNDNV